MAKRSIRPGSAIFGALEPLTHLPRPLRTPEALRSLDEELLVAVDDLAARYRDVLPVEAIAAVIGAARASELAALNGDADPLDHPTVLAGQIVARAKAELAIAVGAPVSGPAVPSSRGLATAWTHVLEGLALVRAVGDFDLATAPILSMELSQALASGRGTILVDLGRVSFMDIAGLAAIRQAAQSADAIGRRLLLVQVPAAVNRLIERSGVDLYLNPEARRSRLDGTGHDNGP